MRQHNYFVYITTTSRKTVLYVGMTNNVAGRTQQHFENRNNPKSFAGRYKCYYLVYYERFQYVQDAIDREKEIKKWRREKKIKLIEEFNPTWKFLNWEVFENE